MAVKRKLQGRVSFNPIVAEKNLENSDDDEVVAEEGEEDEVVRELEMDGEATDEVEGGDEEEDNQTLTADEARDIREHFQKMKVAKDTGFNKGEVILVRPDGVPKRRKADRQLLWKARVVNVRKDESGDIFLGIEWYYSASQMSALSVPKKAKFQPDELCGQHELIETNHTDVIPRESYVDHLDLRRLTDNNDQEEIAEGTWYTRAFYDLKTGKFKVKTAPCSMCHEHYKPETQSEQAYCPGCAKWYHHECLHEKGGQCFQEEYEADITKTLASNIRVPSVEPQAKRRRNSTAKGSPRAKTNRGAELRAQRMLRKIAGTRIVRGGEFGITGTVKEITTARKIVYELDNGIRMNLLDTEWQKEVGAMLVKAAEDWPDKADWCYSCPKCQNAI